MKAENITFQAVVVGLGSVKVEVVGKLAFEMYGAKFGVHRQQVRDPYGIYENFIVTDIRTGYQLGSSTDEEAAIAGAKERLEMIGQENFYQAEAYADE